MKPSGLVVLLAGICCTSPGAASAPINFVCSAPLGRTSEFWQVRTESSYRLRGRIEPQELDRLPADPTRMDGHNIPSIGRGADVAISRPSEQVYLTFGVAADVEGRRLSVRAASDNEGRESVETVASLDWQPGARVSIPFEVAVEAERVSLRIGTRDIRFDIALGSGSEVRFGCEGGTFRFTDLEIDN